MNPAAKAEPAIVIAVSDLEDWPLHIPGVEVVLGRRYLTDPRWSGIKRLRVFNLCRSYQYQTTGYYVSLLATARGHTPFPDLTTLLDMRSRVLVRAADDELDELVQRSLAPIRSKRFEVSVYFGRNLAKRYEKLALKIFNLFPAPLLRAQFTRDKRWRLTSVSPIPAREIPPSHHPFVLEVAQAYFGRKRLTVARNRAPRWSLALLHDREEALPPSNSKALERFERAAARVGFDVERIGKDDYGRLSEFDALFIRETTRVNHHTFRFARRAEAEGLAVIDDPRSILRCSNKVYLAERLGLRGLPIPRTFIADRERVDEIAASVGLPCVLKHPDSAFSQGVVRCADEEELSRAVQAAFESSDLVVAQEWLPTGYDWRIGVLDQQPLYACRYHMAEGHWQIVHTTAGGHHRYGKVEPVPLDRVPPKVLKNGVRAANLIGDGLYGVDLKVIGERVVVIEVNDNPNLDGGLEDKELGQELWMRLARAFLRRVEERKGKRW